MPQSLARVVLHVVFSTKNRVPFLKDPELRARLHAYMAGALQAIGCGPILINGVEDHVHILCNLSRTVTIAGLVEAAKGSPSKWMKEQGASYRDFYWQGGYVIFRGPIERRSGPGLCRDAGGASSRGVISG